VPAAVLVAATLVLVWRRSAIGYLGAFALAILAPTLMVPIVTEIAAERRMYLPLAALVTLIVVGGYATLRHILNTRYALTTIAAAVLLLACVGGIASSMRLATYGDELTLWQDVLDHDPHNATAEYNVGTIYLHRNEPQRAIAYFERAVAIRPDYAPAHFNLGTALTALGRQQEATAHLQRAIDVEPGYVLGYVKMGYVHLNAGRAADAIEQFRAALQLQPENVAARTGLSGALLADGQREDALSQARTAVELAPDNAAARNALGAALAQAGQFGEAVEQFEAAVRLEPTLAQAQGNLMAAYASLGRNDEAIATADRALKLARANGDTALEAQISAFLADFQSRQATGPTLGAERDQD
jgi:tetratricopeptide (TPR) repeat protein